jgi:hypothetical protein
LPGGSISVDVERVGRPFPWVEGTDIDALGRGCMTSSAGALDSCPGGDHLQWFLAAISLGSGPVDLDPSVLGHHLDPADSDFATMASQISALAGGPLAHVETLRWHRSRTGEVVVSYRSDDGREWDLAATLGPDDRIAKTTSFRTVEGVDFSGRAPATATDEESRLVHDLFDRAYRDGDHAYLDEQLERLALGLAWMDRSVIGFNLANQVEVDLPVVGICRLWVQGLTCVDPTVHRRGVASNLPAVTRPGMGAILPHDAYVARYAHPASLLGSLRINGSPWPGRTVEEMAGAYSAASSAQRAIARSVAADLGSPDFDEQHWVCIGPGRPVGDPVVEIDAPPGAWEFFASANRSRGDTVLGLHWVGEPPATWWT